MFPINAANMHAIRVDAFDALFGSDQPNLAIIKHQNDNGQILANRCMNIGNRHQQAAITGKGKNGPVTMRQTGGKSARDRKSH